MENGSRTNMNGLVEKKRKLVLHFDVRNTILVADSVTNVHVEEAINSYLTGVTWGREVPGGDKPGAENSWEWVSDTPSPYPPCDGCITYYKHREKELVKTPGDRAVLRQVTGHFTQEPLGERFHPYFIKILNHLRWPHPAHPDPQLTMPGKRGHLYHYILPAFFKLIQHLHDTHRDFAVVLRTYGLDCPNVLQCIDQSLKGTHPRFKDAPMDQYHVNLTHGKIVREGPDKITFEHHEGGKVRTMTNERDIYDFLSSMQGVCGYVDDFTHWQDHNYHFDAAKPHWIDPRDESVHHIFFDDNLRVTDDDSIVNTRFLPPRQPPPQDTHITSPPNGLTTPQTPHDNVVTSKDREDNNSTTSSRKDVTPIPQDNMKISHTDSSDHQGVRSLGLEETTQLENVCLVLADLLESTADLDYFIKKIDTCEERYSQYLRQYKQ